LIFSHVPEQMDVRGAYLVLQGEILVKGKSMQLLHSGGLEKS